MVYVSSGSDSVDSLKTTAYYYHAVKAIGGRPVANIIETLIPGVLEDVAQRQLRTPLEQVKQRARHQSEALSFMSILRATVGAVSIISEVKRRSPFQGFIGPIPDPAALAEQCVEGGAVAMSVITESRNYGGSWEDLDLVRSRVDVPVICRDIILTPYQLHEARAHGADAVVLIVAALKQNALISLIERTESLGMTAVVEAHSRIEALHAIEAGARIVGVSALDLKTLKADPHTIPETIDVIPSGVFALAEFIARSPRDVMELAKWGADGVVVGEAIVTSPNPHQTVRDMVSAGQHPALHTDRRFRVQAALEEEKGDLR